MIDVLATGLVYRNPNPERRAIHAWHPASLRCLIESGAQPNAKNWQHIERIAGTDTALVTELRQLANSTEQHP